ncbi:MAG: NUDIX domain-containing protein [Parcubacteria group bacterium]|nr:NUDIX domain-containing protein [Parcubacteria group bacterium]
MPKEFEKFIISQVAVLIRDEKCLILEFSDMPGRWGLPGGRLDVGEVGEPALRREIEEELGLANFENLGVVDYETWHIPRSTDMKTGTPLCGIANLIENDEDEIKLSHEHSQLKWATEDELENYDFVWPPAARMLKKGFAYKKLLDQANEGK